MVLVIFLGARHRDAPLTGIPCSEPVRESSGLSSLPLARGVCVPSRSSAVYTRKSGMEARRGDEHHRTTTPAATQAAAATPKGWRARSCGSPGGPRCAQGVRKTGRVFLFSKTCRRGRQTDAGSVGVTTHVLSMLLRVARLHAVRRFLMGTAPPDILSHPLVRARVHHSFLSERSRFLRAVASARFSRPHVLSRKVEGSAWPLLGRRLYAPRCARARKERKGVGGCLRPRETGCRCVRRTSG